MSRIPLVAGNWKMNGSAASVAALLDGIQQQAVECDNAELAVFPPYIYLQQCQQALHASPIKWGAQNMSEHEAGAYTGEISASMLLDACCEYVILGHSERRTLFHETDSLIFNKFKKALNAGLKPILCVGETLEQYERGETLKVVQEQLAKIITLQDNLASLAVAVIAYEPVWAIGTGKTATPEQAQQVHCSIRDQLKSIDATLATNMRILYGGSVKQSNAAELFAMSDIDGALVGGASLDAQQFIAIGKACNK
ncbi:MAG: triose-phosphate isomerase [Gammaproteobacteria bacterium]|nr:triose-phosphate isomerase [Gammaproteobacteria bacterium]